tara:strand:- start:233 stop:1423 length:1191 start_codon:yes stop_codon:yes gene_type:complete
MDKIYSLSDAEYHVFYEKYKKDLVFIKQILLSNFTILMNKNIDILKKLVSNNLSDKNELKETVLSEFNAVEQKLKVVKVIDQSVIIDKIYVLIRKNKDIILNLYNPEKIDSTISIKKIFNFMTCDNNVNLKKLYTGMHWLFKKYGNNNNNNANSFINDMFNGDDKTRIQTIIKNAKTNYSDIRNAIINSYNNIETYIKIDNISKSNETKRKCEHIINQSINDMSYKHFYLITKLIKKLILSYDTQYSNQYEFILFNIIVDEFNNELLCILSINEEHMTNDDNINKIINSIDENVLRKYNEILYNNLIDQDIFSDVKVKPDNIKQIIYDFVKETDLYDKYNQYIDYYIDILFQLINNCKIHINNFLYLNIPDIRDFNKNLYHLLILSNRYYDLQLEF